MASAENRFRKIEMRMWADQKFRALSPLPPSGQSLWLYLLTGPHTGIIPGLFKARRGGLVEELAWSPEAFDTAFAEITSLQMAEADWKVGVVWIPNAIKCNLPQSPNVITAWRKEWPLIPDCDLKTRAYEAIRSAIYAMPSRPSENGKGFRGVFDEVFRESSAKAFRKPLEKAMPNQEQLAVSRKQETGGESSSLPTPESQNRSETVNRIGYLYPGNKTLAGKPLPQSQKKSISAAIDAHGAQQVLQGTAAFAVLVAKWPASEHKFIPRAERFYDECQYLKDPAVWGVLYPGEVRAKLLKGPEHSGN